MNQKIKSRIQLFLIITGATALLYVYGVGCTSDLNLLTAGQVLASGGIGVTYFGIAVYAYKQIGKEEYL